MAKFNSLFDVSGGFDRYVVYRLPGSDKLILRTKGKVSKNKRKKSPSFALVRKYEAEFGGRGTATSWIRAALKGQTALIKFGAAFKLNPLLKSLQVMDSSSPLGQRSILFSRGAEIFNGFYLTQTTPFDSIVVNPIPCSLSKQSLSAVVNIPALLPGINFNSGERDGMYKLIASLSVVPDLHYNGKKYAPSDGYSKGNFVTAAATNWYPIKKGSLETVLNPELTDRPPDTEFALLLSIGIQFGTMIGADSVVSSGVSGAAMILKMV